MPEHRTAPLTDTDTHIQALFDTAIAQGEEQRNAFAGMEVLARRLVAEFVTRITSKKCTPDGRADYSPYANEEDRFWVIRPPRSDKPNGGTNTSYGGGSLVDYNYGDYCYRWIVADGKGGLTTLKTERSILTNFDHDNYKTLEHPSDAADRVFNRCALLASPELCSTAFGEITRDVLEATKRVIRENR